MSQQLYDQLYSSLNVAYQKAKAEENPDSDELWKRRKEKAQLTELQEQLLRDHAILSAVAALLAENLPLWIPSQPGHSSELPYSSDKEVD